MACPHPGCTCNGQPGHSGRRPTYLQPIRLDEKAMRDAMADAAAFAADRAYRRELARQLASHYPQGITIDVTEPIIEVAPLEPFTINGRRVVWR